MTIKTWGNDADLKVTLKFGGKIILSKTINPIEVAISIFVSTDGQIEQRPFHLAEQTE